MSGSGCSQDSELEPMFDRNTPSATIVPCMNYLSERRNDNRF